MFPANNPRFWAPSEPLGGKGTPICSFGSSSYLSSLFPFLSFCYFSPFNSDLASSRLSLSLFSLHSICAAKISAAFTPLFSLFVVYHLLFFPVCFFIFLFRCPFHFLSFRYLLEAGPHNILTTHATRHRNITRYICRLISKDQTRRSANRPL